MWNKGIYEWEKSKLNRERSKEMCSLFIENYGECKAFYFIYDPPRPPKQSTENYNIGTQDLLLA